MRGLKGRPLDIVGYGEEGDEIGDAATNEAENESAGAPSPLFDEIKRDGGGRA
jgi:hypothetical protein